MDLASYISITVIYSWPILQELQPLVCALIVRLEPIRLDQVEWLLKEFLSAMMSYCQSSGKHLVLISPTLAGLWIVDIYSF